MAKSKKKKRPKTVERKIYFYRLTTAPTQSGKQTRIDLIKPLQHVGSLAWKQGERYMDVDPETFVGCWVDDTNPTCRLRLAQIRRSALPLVEQAGKLSGLNIPAQSGIAEQVHIVSFPHNIIGSEFNFRGPRATRLSSYLRQKAPHLTPYFDVDALLRDDPVEQLDRVREVKLFQLRVLAPYASRLAQANESVGAMFTAAENVSEAEEVEVVLRVPARSERSLNNLIPAAKKFFRRKDFRENVTQFKMNAYLEGTKGVQAIDLLSDALIAKKEILQEDPRTRALDSRSAYHAIESAYAELREDLKLAAGIG